MAQNRFKKKFSVVIPALNEGKNIGPCLASIFKQDYAKSNYEVIVVDAMSEDKTPEIAKKMGAKVLKSKLRKIGYQRQMGADASCGEITVFLDADGTVYPGLFTGLERVFSNANVVAMQGKILIQNPTFFEKYIGLYIYNLVLAILAPAGKFATGSCIAIRKRTLDAIGGFNVKKISAEDIELLDQARKHGKVVYEPRIAVETSPRRIRKWGYIKTLVFQGTNLLRYIFTGKSSTVYEDIRD